MASIDEEVVHRVILHTVIGVDTAVDFVKEVDLGLAATILTVRFRHSWRQGKHRTVRPSD